MSIFIDTGIFVALRNSSDKNHQRAEELMEPIMEGEFGTIYTSDYVMDEATTTALARTKKHELAIDVGEFILNSPRIRKLRVTKSIFDGAWEQFKSFEENPMSFTDCTSLALMDANRIDRIASFDSGFDGLVERIS